MPDWSYQTLFRPALFRFPVPVARDWTLAVMGGLAALPFGGAVIDLLGHMRPPPALRREAFGLAFSSPVGLEAGLDPRLLGIRALQRFGFGFLEVGPVTAEPALETPPQRIAAQEAIWYGAAPAGPGADALEARLRALGSLDLPLGVRLTTPDLIERFAPYADFLILPADCPDWESAVRAAGPKPVVILIAPDLPTAAVAHRLEPALRAGIAGVLVGGGVEGPDGGRIEGLPAQEPTLRMVRHLRKDRSLPLPIIAGGGVHEPADALRLLEAGATLVQVHAGLIYSGPGLPKRINEAITYRAPATAPAEGQKGWVWALLLGWGMLMGGLLAAWVAFTRVLLPYDEAFVGLSRAELEAVNPRLLAFMAHDRISLAGTMAAIGLLYLYLAWYPMRRGEHWARAAFQASGIVGFASFLLFLGYGYFDPLHAAVSLALLPFFLIALWQSRGANTPPASPNLHNDRPWRTAQWGQLLLVALGAAILAAGVTIAAIGVTRVFVPEDLAFMQTTADVLQGAHPRLVPLIAHDRAGFGGALVCNGLTVLLLALWGFRQGARWLWWAMGLSGTAAYAAALWTHLQVGYVDQIHLVPLYAGWSMLYLALGLSWRYLWAGDRGRAAPIQSGSVSRGGDTVTLKPEVE